MLKVVGASWVQTRISWTLLGSFTLLGFVAMYFGPTYRAEADGKYAATVFYGKETKFRLEYWGQNNDPQDIKKGAARGYYQPDNSKTGWATIEIETQASFPDAIQACAAGMLEGALSWQHIQHHWQNTIQRTCVGRQEFCTYTRAFLQKNFEHIKKFAEKFDHIDPFWHQVNLFYVQLEGIEIGWRSGAKRSRRDYVDIPKIDFLWMNVLPDLRDFERKFNGTVDFNPHRPPLSFALLKYFPDNPSEYILAHSSAGTYSSMLRIQKRYIFGYHSTGDFDSDLINGRIQTFTSYPGAIFSGDDYYQIENDEGEMLTVIGTELRNYNQSSWNHIDYEHQVLMGPRVVAANRLSRDGDDWSAIFTRRNSGTGNKQWLVIDTSENFTVWAVEQMPGLTHAQEVTQQIIEKKYWIACGIPYFQDILLQSSGYNDVSSLHHLKNTNPLYVVLRKYVNSVVDIDSIVNLVRSYEISVIGRSDLNGVNNLYAYLNVTKSMNTHFHHKRQVDDLDDHVEELKLSKEAIKEDNVEEKNLRYNENEGAFEENWFEKERSTTQIDEIKNIKRPRNDNFTKEPKKGQTYFKNKEMNSNHDSQSTNNAEQVGNVEQIRDENAKDIDETKTNNEQNDNINSIREKYVKNLKETHKYSGIYKINNRKMEEIGDLKNKNVSLENNIQNSRQNFFKRSTNHLFDVKIDKENQNYTQKDQNYSTSSNTNNQDSKTEGTLEERDVSKLSEDVASTFQEITNEYFSDTFKTIEETNNIGARGNSESSFESNKRQIGNNLSAIKNRNEQVNFNREDSSNIKEKQNKIKKISNKIPETDVANSNDDLETEKSKNVPNNQPKIIYFKNIDDDLKSVFGRKYNEYKENLDKINNEKQNSVEKDVSSVQNIDGRVENSNNINNDSIDFSQRVEKNSETIGSTHIETNGDVVQNNENNNKKFNINKIEYNGKAFQSNLNTKQNISKNTNKESHKPHIHNNNFGTHRNVQNKFQLNQTEQDLFESEDLNNYLNQMSLLDLTAQKNEYNKNKHIYKDSNKHYRGIIDVKINQGNRPFLSISGPPFYKNYKATTNESVSQNMKTGSMSKKLGSDSKPNSKYLNNNEFVKNINKNNVENYERRSNNISNDGKMPETREVSDSVENVEKLKPQVAQFKLFENTLKLGNINATVDNSNINEDLKTLETTKKIVGQQLLSAETSDKPAENSRTTETTTSNDFQSDSTTEESQNLNNEINVKPFQWSKSHIRFLQHIGHPDLWDFQIFKPDWAWK